MKPTRVQLSRRRGWRMPRNTLRVDRTTLFGNPFDVREYGHDLALRLFEDTARGTWLPANASEVDEPTREILFEAHHRWINRLGGNPIEAIRTALRGRHLACWCALPSGGHDDLCHAAILLRIANAVSAEDGLARPFKISRGEGASK